MTRPKHKPLRDREMLDLAHSLHDCTIGIPGVCHGTEPDGLEPSHGPKSWLDGGAGMKSSDVFAAACHPCHYELDFGINLSREERGWYWGRGAARTWAELRRRGWLVVVKPS